MATRPLLTRLSLETEGRPKRARGTSPTGAAFRKQEVLLNKHLIASVTRSFRSSGLKYALPLFAALAAAGPAGAPAAGREAGPFTEESKLDKAQTGFYRLRIGKIDVTALSD